MSKGHMEALAALKARKPVTRAVTFASKAKESFHAITPGDILPFAKLAKPGEKCPTCGCKVPKRQTAAQRQRDSRSRKKAHDQKARAQAKG